MARATACRAARVCYARPVASRPIARRSAEPFGEKDFYLEEFRGRTMLFVVDATVAASRARLDDLARTVRALLRNRTRVLLWWPGASARGLERMRRALAAAGRRGDATHATRMLAVPAKPATERDVRALLAAAWLRLRRGGFCLLAVGGDTEAALHLAARMSVAKVVVVHRGGGLRTSGGVVSFVDEGVLETVLRDGEAEWAGFGERRALLRAVLDAIDAGVASVNLCAPQGVSRELFTYVGSGTLFTEGDYAHVERLPVDLYRQAEVMIRRGEREGVLKRRSTSDVAELLAGGYGAVLGRRHLAGVASLLTARYEGSGFGELAALYTITRFQGEGLGRRLIDRVMADATARGLDWVFACTVDRRAKTFFEENAFVRVRRTAVPAAKWHGYDPKRARRVACFRRAC
jgi:amino-acid N-acetyltransferase